MSGKQRGNLPVAVRVLIGLVSRLVPRLRRAEWREEWEAELWHARRRGGADDPAERGVGTQRLLRGMIPHALWERRHWSGADRSRLSDFVSDVRFGVRLMRRSPGFAFVAILTIGLGIGGNTAVFSVVNGVLLRPLPYAEPDRVVHVGWDWNGSGALETDALSSSKFEYLREHQRVFDGVATWRTFEADVGERGESGQVKGLYVSDDFFRVIGRVPREGRSFAAEEQVRGGRDVAIVSDAFWRDRLGGDPGVLGRDVELSGRRWQVVGVMPPGFEFPPAGASTEVILPLRFQADPRDHGHNTPVIARLGGGVTRALALADLDRVFAAMRLEHPDVFDSPKEQARLSDYRSIYLGDIRSTLWVLLGAVFVVLMISCANVANLLLARGTARRREMAVRATLGAGRGRIARQVLSESLVLALTGGMLGLAIGVAGLHLLLRLAPSGLIGLEHVAVDRMVLLFTLFASLAAGLIFGLVAAVPALRVDLMNSVREVRSMGSGRKTGFVRQSLIVAESALAVMLLAGAGLLIASFAGLRRADLGFDARNLYTLQFRRAPADYSGPARSWDVEQRILERIDATPGVVTAAGTAVLPFTRGWNIPMTVQGRPEASEGGMEWRMVSRQYFDVMGIPLVRGRGFDEADIESGRPVVLINESFARRYWLDGDPLGSQLRIGYYKGKLVIPGFEDPPREVIGIVADVKERGPGQPVRRTMYVPHSPYLGQLSGIPAFVIRGSRGLDVEALRSAVAEVDPRLPLPDVERGDVLLRRVLAQDRFNMLLMAVFAAIALALTAIGVFGVVAYTVRQRQSEIGVRVALGADRGHVVTATVWRGMVPLLAGLGIGTLLALGLTRFMSSMLHDISTTDPLTFTSAIVVLLATGLLACWLPARRAARIDPVIALRAD